MAPFRPGGGLWRQQPIGCETRHDLVSRARETVTRAVTRATSRAAAGEDRATAGQHAPNAHFETPQVDVQPCGNVSRAAFQPDRGSDLDVVRRPANLGIDSGDGSLWRSDGVGLSGRKPWLASRDYDKLA